MRRLEGGGGAAPAAAARDRGAGRPRVVVRWHYDRLPLMAGRGVDEGRRKPPGYGCRKASVCARKHDPADRNAAMERRRACASHRTHAAPESAECMVRLAVLHPLFMRRGKKKDGAPRAANNRGARACHRVTAEARRGKVRARAKPGCLKSESEKMRGAAPPLTTHAAAKCRHAKFWSTALPVRLLHA
jgi:hypothetical protein